MHFHKAVLKYKRARVIFWLYTPCTEIFLPLLLFFFIFFFFHSSLFFIFHCLSHLMLRMHSTLKTIFFRIRYFLHPDYINYHQLFSEIYISPPLFPNKHTSCTLASTYAHARNANIPRLKFSYQSANLSSTRTP